MFDEKCLKEVKSCLDRVADKTMRRLSANDRKYQALSQESSEARLAYRKLDLSEHSKEVIKRYMDLNDSLGAETASLSYLAGILDGRMFLEIILPDSKRCTGGMQASTDFIRDMGEGALNDDSILEQLYNGELNPNAQINPSTPEYKELQLSLDAKRKHFEIELSQDNFQRFDEFEQMLFKLFQLDCQEHFTHGFKMGARMMAEALGNCPHEPSDFGAA